MQACVACLQMLTPSCGWAGRARRVGAPTSPASFVARAMGEGSDASRTPLRMGFLDAKGSHSRFSLRAVEPRSRILWRLTSFPIAS